MIVRLRAMEALAKAPATAQYIAKATRSSLQSVRNSLSIARRHGHVEATVANGWGKAPTWSLTAAGRKELVSPSAKRQRNTKAIGIANEIRKARYAIEHARHVERQKRMGLPDSLIDPDKADEESEKAA